MGQGAQGNVQRLCRGERAQPGHRSAATREAHSSRAPAHVAFSVLADPSRRAAIRSDCYEMLRTELTMRPAALLHAQLAADVRSGARMIQRRSRCRPGRRWWPVQHAGELPIGRTPCAQSRFCTRRGRFVQALRGCGQGRGFAPSARASTWPWCARPVRRTFGGTHAAAVATR